MNISRLRANDKLNPPMPLIGAEAAAASLAAFLSSAILSAYLADRIGFPIPPFAILVVAAAIAAAIWLRLRRDVTSDRPAFAAFALIAFGTFAWLMFRARPDFLPAGAGSDLAHHLALLAYLERHWRLPHDPALGAYLGEMIDYTPGAHLLAVLAGAWLRRDALHVVHAVVALTVALKSGLVFLIARRLMPDGAARVPFAIVAALLLWLPSALFVGSFMTQSFLSQVVSELFAVAMWWALAVWNEHPSAGAMALFALFGTAAFLTWPIWIGPLVLTLAALALGHRDISWTTRLRHVTIALLPIAIVSAMYASARQVYGFQMVHAVGFAIWPTPRVLGWPFILLAGGGLVWSAMDRRARSAAVLVAAIALQAAALIVTGRSSGADAPYLSLKMCYFVIYPLSVAAAAMLASVWRAALRPADATRYAWIPVVVVALGVARSLASAPPVTRVVTEPAFLAGEWARTRVPPGCVDYLVADGYTGYWLHLAVLGNPRATGRSLDDDTFEPKKAIVRWILPGGLPYAIADDFDALPRDIRTNVDVLARFGPAAVVKRRGVATCEDTRSNRSERGDR
jgi:hypothetical protein